jgi:glycosyltransferase involved in cell wall biosynthesis
MTAANASKRHTEFTPHLASLICRRNEYDMPLPSSDPALVPRLLESRRRMRILTNFPRFPEKWRSSSGLTGDAERLQGSTWQFFRASKRADLVLINCDLRLAMKLAALYLIFPWRRRPIQMHDVILRRPVTLKARLAVIPKRFLISRLDHMTIHFRDLSGYRRFFGVRPERISYLPFKPNIRDRYRYKVGAEGEYVLCFGRSERDYDTFFRAMELLPDVPAAIPPPNFASFRKHGARFTYGIDRLPPNVGIVPDEGTEESMIRILENARLIALPLIAGRIGPSGVGLYLTAMLMGKCVITTHGPTTSDVLLDGEALLVAPEDPAALAAMIRRAWDDRQLRERTAEIGRRYAEACGGEPELLQRVLDRAVEVFAP